MPTRESRSNRKSDRPTLGDICTTIAWTSLYAKEELNESHPMWADYFAYSEWFRHRISSQLGLPLNTEWKKIYKLVGCLYKDEYTSETEFGDAFHFGETRLLDDEMATAMLDKFEMIKFQIVQRD